MRNLDVSLSQTPVEENSLLHVIRVQLVKSSTAEPLCKGREICTITSRAMMIHNPDTSTFNSVDIRRIRRVRNILRRHDNKGLGLAPCPSEFVDGNISGRTQEYVRYVYYARTRRYVSVLHPYL